MKKKVKAIMLPAEDKSRSIGQIVKAVFPHPKAEIGELFISDMNVSESQEEPQHLYFVSNDEIKAGDWCMFYNQLSEVISVSNGTAQIRTTTIMSKEDAQFINDIKGTNYKEGSFGKMTHGFSICQLPKVIATTDKSLLINWSGHEEYTAREISAKVYLPQIPQSFVESYVNNPVEEVEVDYFFVFCWCAQYT